MLGFLVVLASAVAVFYIALCLALFFRQGAHMYVPDRDVEMTPTRINIAYEEVRLKTEDGETIAGWFIPAYGPGEVKPGELKITGKTVLLCHGNGGDTQLCAASESERLHLLGGARHRPRSRRRGFSFFRTLPWLLALGGGGVLDRHKSDPPQPYERAES